MGQVNGLCHIPQTFPEWYLWSGEVHNPTVGVGWGEYNHREVAWPSEGVLDLQ